MTTFNAFCLTIRPIGGVIPDGELERKVLTYIQSKKFRHCIAVAELAKPGDLRTRHIHAGVWLDKTQERKDNIQRDMKKIMKDYPSNEIRVSAVKGTKVMYDMNWTRKYIQKDLEKDSVMLVNNIAPDDWEFVNISRTEAEEKSQDKKPDVWEVFWEYMIENINDEKYKEDRKKEITRLYTECMFKDRIIDIIVRSRDRAEYITCFVNLAFYHYKPKEDSVSEFFQQI